MTASTRILPIVSLILAGTSMIGATAASAGTCPALVVPAYFDSNALWEQVIDAPAKEVAIMNPANGPGTRAQASYKNWIATAKANGVTVIGYIATGYGTTAASKITTQAQHYSQWYGVTDFFLDEASASTRNLSTYKSLVGTLDKSYNNPLIMLNPGTVPAQGYFGLGANTQIVVFEDKASAFSATLFPAWLQPYYSRSAIIAYEANNTQMNNIVSLAKTNGFGGAYVTDEGASGNPYAELPSYWTQETAAGCAK